MEVNRVKRILLLDMSTRNLGLKSEEKAPEASFKRPPLLDSSQGIACKRLYYRWPSQRKLDLSLEHALVELLT